MRPLYFILVFGLLIGFIWLVMSGIFSGLPVILNKVLILGFIAFMFLAPRFVGSLFRPRKPKMPSASQKHYDRTRQTVLSNAGAQSYYDALRSGGMPANRADEVMADVYPGQPYIKRP